MPYVGMIKKTDIPNDTVSYAKIQNIEANNVLLGNIAGAGKPIVELAKSDIRGIIEPEVVLVSTGTASNASAITFTGLSSAYLFYEVTYVNVTAASNWVSFLLRTSTDNGSSYDSGASDYAWARTYTNGATTTLANDANDASIPLAGDVLLQNVDAVNGKVVIYNPSATTETAVRNDWSRMDSVLSSVEIGMTAGKRKSAADVDAIQFLMSSGNIATGTFKLYGYK